MRFFLFLLLTVPGISLVANPPFPEFQAVEIDSDVHIGYGVAVADVNGNGELDILLADSREIFWYENPTWKMHRIAEGLTAQQ